MTRKIPLIACLGMALAGLSSCGSSRKAVAFFIYDETDIFMGSVGTILEDTLGERYSFDAYDGERNQSNQTRQVVEALESGNYGALVVNMVDRLAASAIVEKAYTCGVPVVFSNREPLEEDIGGSGDLGAWSEENCYYVGCLPSYDGEVQAEIADRYLSSAEGWDKNGDGKVQVALLKGEQGHQDTEERSFNCLQGLRDRGYELEIVHTAYCDWDRTVAYDETGEMNLGQVELLFSNNDEMALGAIEYLIDMDNAGEEGLEVESEEREENIEGTETEATFAARHFPIVGVDCTDFGREAVEAGYMVGTVLNDAVTQAALISEIVFSLLDGDDWPETPEKIELSGNFYYVKGEAVYCPSLAGTD